jgi:hypothetical protein
MPVYLLTIHAYRSWSEGNTKGYVQRDDGLKPSSPNLASWREENSSHDPARFGMDDQQLLHEILVTVASERKCRLHAGATTPTHVHGLTSFLHPSCECDGAKWCRRGCGSRGYMEKFTTRLKQKMGQALAKKYQTNGRPYFSRGWDLTPIRRMPHFRYQIETYLPKHAKEGGIFRFYE